MRFTDYGRAMAQAEAPFETSATGAQAHMEACGYDVGTDVVLTGTDVNGRRFRRAARSVRGAHAQAVAAWGVTSAWHVGDDGRRRLLFAR